jgi:hemerythrin HHE cation binding domain-containing protein
MASTAHELLSHDHEAVHEVLAQLLTALNNRQVQASYDKLDLLWARLAVHIRAEHLHLFPAVVSHLAEAAPTVDRLREDHNFFMRELARAVDIVRELLSDGSNREARLVYVLNLVLGLEDRLTTHNDIEENEIYSWISTMLTAPEQMELMARMKAELDHRPSRFSASVWANEP